MGADATRSSWVGGDARHWGCFDEGALLALVRDPRLLIGGVLELQSCGRAVLGEA
jgi:hypothetical protein